MWLVGEVGVSTMLGDDMLNWVGKKLESMPSTLPFSFESHRGSGKSILNHILDDNVLLPQEMRRLPK